MALGKYWSFGAKKFGYEFLTLEFFWEVKENVFLWHSDTA